MSVFHTHHSLTTHDSLVQVCVLMKHAGSGTQQKHYLYTAVGQQKCICLLNHLNTVYHNSYFPEINLRLLYVRNISFNKYKTRFMKRIAIPFLLLTVCAAGVSAQERTTIEPSGNIITKDVSVKSFDAIEAQGLYELILSQGDKESVKIEADDNLMDLFSVTNDGSSLVINMPKLKDKNINFKNKKDDKKLRLKVYVTFKKLKSLDIGVIGNVRSETMVKADAFNLESKNVGNVDLQLTTDKLTVKNKGVGNITLRGNAKDADVTNAGVGQFDGSDLVVQTMHINNSGVGSADVNVEKDITIKQSFLGKVNNKGNAKTHKMEGVAM